MIPRSGSFSADNHSRISMSLSQERSKSRGIRFEMFMFEDRVLLRGETLLGIHVP